MIIDVRNIEYRTHLIRETGEKLDISNIVEELSWGDSDKELAARGQASFPNMMFKGQYLTNIIKLNSKIVIQAQYGFGWREVFRGSILQKSYASADEKRIDLNFYDDLFFLQRNEEQRYISAGTSCKSAIERILSDWNVPYLYSGPTTKVGKLISRSNTVAENILSLLQDVKNKGAGKYIIRSEAGTAKIIQAGSNTDVFIIDTANCEGIQDDQSIEDLITRVRVMLNLGEDEYQSATQAVVNGQTQFGIFQKILYVSSDDDLSEATENARDIIREKGSVDQKLQIKRCIDVPVMRKGDKVKIIAGTMNGYYLVKSIQHNAPTKSMSLEVEPWTQ